MMTAQVERIFVVGGSTGIGLATARLAAARGHEVAINGRSEEVLRAAAQSIEGDVHWFAADFRNAEAMTEAFRDFGPFDHLVLAGACEPAPGAFRETSAERLRAAFEGKVFAYWSCLQLALPRLRADGSVTMLGGLASRIGAPNLAGVSAVNGAITQMLLTLCRELAPLRVNAVSPGIIDTPAWSGVPPNIREGAFAKGAQAAAVGRIGRPEEVADAILFLVGNRFTNGALLDVDGGAR